jgi:hypothetical protein
LPGTLIKIAIAYLSFLDGMMLNSLIAEGYIDVKLQIAFFLQNLAPLLRSGQGSDIAAARSSMPEES